MAAPQVSPFIGGAFSTTAQCFPSLTCCLQSRSLQSAEQTAGGESPSLRRFTPCHQLRSITSSPRSCSRLSTAPHFGTQSRKTSEHRLYYLLCSSVSRPCP